MFHFIIHFIATINIEINHSLIEAEKPHTKKPYKHTDKYFQYSHQINIFSFRSITDIMFLLQIFS